MVELDKLILQFCGTDAAKAMVSAWQAARATKNRDRAGTSTAGAASGMMEWRAIKSP